MDDLGIRACESETDKATESLPTLGGLSNNLLLAGTRLQKCTATSMETVPTSLPTLNQIAYQLVAEQEDFECL